MNDLNTWDAEDFPELLHPKKPEDNFWYHFRCWFSKRFWDIHNEKDSIDIKQPMHFYEYTCEHCNKKFRI